METYFSDQALAFLWSVVLGIALGAVYDVFRVGRILHRPCFVRVLLEDLFFSLIAALATAVCLTLTNYGQVRFFLLVGEAAGFTLWFYTLGQLVTRFAAVLRKIFIKFVNFSKKLFIFLKKCGRMLSCLIIKIFRRRIRSVEKKRNAKTEE